ncbi:MAG: hypothetical protein MK227_03270 [Nitrososphaerales archaeon]|nr:hypothetical protein [Nitrososphaerales archaeon]
MKVKKRYLLINKDNAEDIKSLNLKHIKIVRNSFSKNIILKVKLDNLSLTKEQLISHNIEILQVSGTLKSIKNKKN